MDDGVIHVYASKECKCYDFILLGICSLMSLFFRCCDAVVKNVIHCKALLLSSYVSYVFNYDNSLPFLNVISASEDLFPVASSTTFFTDMHHILRVVSVGNVRSACHHRLRLLEEVGIPNRVVCFMHDKIYCAILSHVTLEKRPTVLITFFVICCCCYLKWCRW